MNNLAIALILFAMASTVFGFEIAPGVNLVCMIIGTVLCFCERKQVLKENRKLKGE